MNKKLWKSFRSEEKERTLLVGSSLVRDMEQSHLVNTDVVCIPGGKISDVLKTVSQAETDKYARIALVVGGNDCDPRNPSTRETPSEIVDKYKSLIQVSKEKARNVLVSSICPRISSTSTMTHIDSVNAGLQVLCAEENVTFIDNTLSFHLKDDSVNDAFFLDDGIHLTYKATNELAGTLQLKLKDGVKTVCSNRRRKHMGAMQKCDMQQSTEAVSAVKEDKGFTHSFWVLAEGTSESSKYSTSIKISK